MTPSSEAILKVSAPWKCKAQVFSMFFLSNPDKISSNDMSAMLYSPLEAESEFAAARSGSLRKGLAGLMVIRYSDTPVGPYDELFVVPGPFSYSVMEDGVLREKENSRITRIYVSQHHTTYNGRFNWNIPKHLARFHWQDLPDGGCRVEVFPFNTSDDPAVTSASSTPFFKATFKTLPLAPAFPFSTAWAKYLGMDLSLVQPPLPQGATSELVGTDTWCKCLMSQSSPRTHLTWFDISQLDDNGQSASLFDNFWPGLGRWHLGLRMDDADIDIPRGDHWAS